MEDVEGLKARVRGIMREIDSIVETKGLDAKQVGRLYSGGDWEAKSKELFGEKSSRITELFKELERLGVLPADLGGRS